MHNHINLFPVLALLHSSHRSSSFRVRRHRRVNTSVRLSCYLTRPEVTPKNLHFYWNLTSCGKDAEILLVARDMLYQNPLSRGAYVVAPGRKNGNDLRETASGINSIPRASDAIRKTEVSLFR